MAYPALKRMLFGEPESSMKKAEPRRTMVQQLEAATGFKFLIKTDTLDDRRYKIRDGIREISAMYAKSVTITDKEKLLQACILIVEDIHAIYFETTSAWMRSREAEWLDEKYSLFLKRCEMYGDIPSALPNLLKNAKKIMNLAFTNLDVEPQTPIVIFTPQQGSGFDMNKALDNLRRGT